MHDRRSVLKTVAGTACLGIVNTVGANDQNQYEEIDQEVFEAFTDDGSDGVRQVMKSRGLDHSLSTDKKIEDTESGPAPYDYHWQDNSDIYVNAFNVDGEDRIRVQAMAGLKTVRPSADSVAFVPDIIGISYISDHWSAVGDESLRTDVDEVDISLFSGTLKKGGYAAEVSHSEPLEPSVNVLLAVTLENLDGVRGQVFSTYEQTRHNFPWGSGPEEVIAGGGPLRVKFGGPFSGSWSMTANTDTDV